MSRLVPLVAVAVLLTGPAIAQNPAPVLDIGTTAFESHIESLRQQANIPGISGALVKDGAVVWERGLGYANVEARVRATPDTPYPVAGVSQAFAAVLVLQCVEWGYLDLDQPVGRYGVTGPDAGTSLRRLLSHTSTGTFVYEPDRYAQLSRVVEFCAPQPYRKTIAHRLLERLALIDSVPGRDAHSMDASEQATYADVALDRYARSLERMAVPYKVDKRGRASRNEIPIEGINAATGLVSTVRDLARFDATLDSELLLTVPTRTMAWSPVLSGDRTPAPAGLGWLVQDYRGTIIVWHFGVMPNAFSALFVKVPSRHATMILLANSDGLAVPFQLEAGDVTRSLFASVFLRMLI